MNRVATAPRPATRRGRSASGRRPAPGAEFRTDIEGLRAVAVLAVVLFHAGVPGVSGGYIGVDVFFVISGFLITGLLWREASGSGSVRLVAFYGARARRLLPAAVLVGVVTAIAAAVLLPPLQVRRVLGDGIASALYVGNYRFAVEGTDYLADTAPSPFQHYWSLGVEEQFYLLWPVLIVGTAWLVMRRGGAAAAHSVTPYVLVLATVGAGSFALAVAWTDALPSWAFFSLPTRAWELAVGGLVALTAVVWRRLPPVPAAIVGWGGLALIVVSCFEFGNTTPFPGTAALLPVSGTALVVGAGCAIPSLGVGHLLSKPGPRAIGRVSYSWYLWHWPVLLLAPVLLGGPLSLPVRLAMVLVSLGLAVLTLHLVENPARFAPALRASGVRSLALGTVATAVAVVAGMVLLAMRPVPVGHGDAVTPLTVSAPEAAADPGQASQTLSPRQQVRAAVARSADVRAVPSNLSPPLGTIAKPEMFVNGCVLSWRDVAQPDCVSGDAASPTKVALFGDSHAAMWHPALEPIARQRGWRLETLSKVTCPPMELPIHSPYLGRYFTECNQWRDASVSRLEQQRPQLIVLDMVRRYGADFGFESYDLAWLEGLTRLVERLRATGAQVLVLGPVPDPHGMVPTCLSAHLDDVAACTTARSVALNSNGIAAESAAVQAVGGSYAELNDLFCTAEHCPVIVGNTLVFRDDNHITAEYAQRLEPVLAEIVDRV